MKSRPFNRELMLLKAFHCNRGSLSLQKNILVNGTANFSFLIRLSADILTKQRKFFGYKTGCGFELLIILATILFGLSIAGICKSIVVDLPSMRWLGVCANTALNHALRSAEAETGSLLQSIQ